MKELDLASSSSTYTTQFDLESDREAPSSQSEKIEHIAFYFSQIMQALGLDLSDPSLNKTPQRVARMFVEELFSGLDPDNFPSITLFPNPQADTSQDTTLIVTKAGFISLCEHHFIPMVGTAYVGYLPRASIIGLSKISRIVRYFAKRPQVQERLTVQIGSALQNALTNEDVAVFIEARHLCVLARGVQDEEATTSTTYMGGVFKDEPRLQNRFFQLVTQEKTTSPSIQNIVRP